MKCLPFALTLFAVLAAVSPCIADEELRALQDSVVRWLAAHPDDLLAEAFTTAWSDEADGCVEVHLLRADSAMKARFRRCVHDSRRIRLAGFDPCTVPYPSAPEGGTAPAALFSMHAEYALYPCDADTVRLTIRNAGRQRLCFGTDYAVCRLHGDRWERLPDGGMWHSLLICLEPENGTAEHRFTARLHPRLFPAAFGRYRICKPVYTEHPRRDYLLTAEFTVMPFVPFTRFVR